MDAVPLAVLGCSVVAAFCIWGFFAIRMEGGKRAMSHEERNLYRNTIKIIAYRLRSEVTPKQGEEIVAQLRGILAKFETRDDRRNG